MKFSKLKINDSANFSKTVTEYDVYAFAGIVGDFNPVHINEEKAKESIFKKRIAHGIISAGFISTVIGTKLPGEGSVYISQECKFLKPVYIGDTITAIVKIIDLEKIKKIVTLETKCINQNDELVVKGISKVKLFE